MDWSIVFAALATIGIPIVRSVGGWAVHALEDNKVTLYEWQQLFATVVRVGLTGVIVYFGAGGWGLDINMFTAQLTSFVFDRIAR